METKTTTKTLLERFCRYVKVETTAVEQTDEYPSSPGQRTLGNMLVEEMKALGIADASADAHGIVTGTIPPTVDNAPAIALFAHLDTSPEASGENVQPIIHEDYDGKDIVLPKDPAQIITVTETPQLADMVGHTLITTDGTTLLGADDKAGVAVIMTAAERILGDPDHRHGPVRIVFTCDEEVGRGVDKIEVDNINATCGYTLDGEGAGSIENETFSANLAVITFTGRNIHPGLAKGKMINAIRLAGLFLDRMPRLRLAPERTAGKEPFMHPYLVEGGVDSVMLRIILRSFETEGLKSQEDTLRHIAASILADHPGADIEIDVRSQYRNMAEALKKEPRAVELAAKAFQNLGMTPRFESIRGGTDGSRLTELGLPTPNLSTGMHNFHSPLEFANLHEMDTAVRVLIELTRLWGQQR